MKRPTLFVALPLVLGLAAAPAALAQDVWDDEAYWEESDFSAFESENWGSDDLGAYDQDFDYGLTEGDSGTEGWLEDGNMDWWGYDDAGDAGFFDI